MFGRQEPEFSEGREPKRYPNVLSYTENGRIAQLVEQRIENPRVPGSIPGSATIFSLIQSTVSIDTVVRYIPN